MYIPKPNSGMFDMSQAEQDLERLIAQPTAQQLRPCPNCQLPCDSDTPAHCAQNCEPSCVNAPAALSSEPEQHPVERHIVNIVFELSSLRLLQPCWSCEGHLNGQGDLWKLPQVSFYASSPLYPQLLVCYLIRLKGNKQLHYPWHISMVNFGQTWVPGYQLEAALNHIDEEVQLERLQQDLQTISANLAERVKQEARQMLAQIRQGGAG